MANKTGDFDVLKLTNAGRDMLTQGRAGHIITFTKVVIGDGTATGSAIDSLTAVKSPKLTLPIAKSENVHAGQMRLQFRVSNSLVNTSFYFREIGLMAKIDNGQEVLYAYTTCGDKAKMVYDKTYPIQEKIINIDTVTDNAVNVKVILDLSIMYATLKDINNALTLDKVYPVGAIYTSVVATNPSQLFGFGTWEELPQGRMLLAQGSNYAAGSTGGEAMHTLTIAEMPRHSHYDDTEAAGNHNHGGTTNSSGNHNHNLVKNFGNSPNRAGNGTYINKDNSDNIRNLETLKTTDAGSHSHTFTTTDNGNHTHRIKADGGSQPHNNMPPYLAVYMWKRVS